MGINLLEFKKIRHQRLRDGGIVLFLCGLLFALLTAGALYFFIDPGNRMAALFTGATTFFVSCLMSIFSYMIHGAPLDTIKKSIIALKDPYSEEQPAQLNDKAVTATGIRSILELIYSGDRSTQKIPKADSAIENTLMRTHVGAVSLSPNNDIVFRNKAAPTQQLSDKTIRLDIESQAYEQITTWANACRQGEFNASMHWSRVATRPRNNSNRRVYDVYASYERNDQADVLLIFIDQTKSYRIEDDQLDFIAFAAHELRSPITVIRGHLDTLRQESIDDPAISNFYTQLLGRIIISSNRLSTSINNILNAARYDGQHMKLTLKKQSLARIFSYCHEDLLMHIQARDRNLVVDIPKKLPKIAADRASLLEVFVNLIENAIKYTQDGGTITVKAREEGNFVTITVQDTGIGIPSNLLPNLFTKFYRSHRSKDFVSGTGIGLFICKMVVESHGGQISVESVEGKGSTFTFTIPIYEKVAKILEANNNSNKELLATSDNKIINHSMYRG